MLHYENLGLCEDGEAGRMIDEGHVQLGGVLVNVSGGLSKGHPLGATELQTFMKSALILEEKEKDRLKEPELV